MEWFLYMVLGLMLLVLAVMLVTRRELRRETDVWHPEVPAADVVEDETDAEEEEDETVLPAPVTVRAMVLTSCRAMDPLALSSASIVTFRTEAEDECTLHVPGEGGLHLLEGDNGLLTVCGDVFISFEKDNGEVIGALYYIPAEETQE